MSVKYLRELLVKVDAPIAVTFTKRDGTQRVMKCTLNERVVPKEDHAALAYRSETPRAKVEGVTKVWDLEARAYRSFRDNSVLQWEILTEENLSTVEEKISADS